ncbi:thioesterase family protein [Drechmeria coniospora]|uniref:Thioesterase family protein n=1 Tax=Drechmeria coniospora TaxID=98403 RepID=A0A151GQC4_DRECN|nr:thioesterase family protein [Drechmeria coniospora]KYK59290.1 thioesterase family protein [Drechmeria coniospora]
MGGDSSDPESRRTAEGKIREWLELTRSEDGHYKAGDWMATLVPFLDVDSASAAFPHPSVTFTYTVQPDHCNRLGNLHGGAAATLFDFCTTMPLAIINRPGFWQYLGVSRSLNVTYLRPVPAGEEVLIECQIVQVGKKLASLRGVMMRKRDGLLLCMCDHGKVNVDPDANL